MKKSTLILLLASFLFSFQSFSQDEVRLDPDSKKAKRLFTKEYEDYKMSSESVLIKGGNFNGKTIAPFYLDKTLVTVAQYEACVKAGVCAPPPDNGNWAATYNRRGNKKRPVNEINWFNAKAYCNWMNKRLPSADEWEWAARGRDESRIYPWGTEIDLKGNTICWQRYDGDSDTGQGTCEVGKHAVSRDGITDMAGNLWEWTSTFADDKKDLVIMKGGAWYNDDPKKLQVTYRGHASPYHSDNASDGFRCAHNQ
jgi:formylglycine-generating enzyme required for sulfatase activity